jgi:hypothetical protein
MDQYPRAAERDRPVGASSEKSSQLLIREYPHRAIAIVSSSHALIFRYSPTTNEALGDGSLAPVSGARPRAGSEGPVSKCMVEFSHITKHLLDDFRPLTPRPVFGTLGLISINQDVFLCVVTQASRVASLRPGETVERIANVDFYCLNSPEYDNVFSLNSWDSEQADSASTNGQNLSRREGEIEYPYQELQKLLSNGSFVSKSHTYILPPRGSGGNFFGSIREQAEPLRGCSPLETDFRPPEYLRLASK